MQNQLKAFLPTGSANTSHATGADPENFNCLFCYCPLYAGRGVAAETSVHCRRRQTAQLHLFPHNPDNYMAICMRYEEVAGWQKRSRNPDRRLRYAIVFQLKGGSSLAIPQSALWPTFWGFPRGCACKSARHFRMPAEGRQPTANYGHLDITALIRARSYHNCGFSLKQTQSSLTATTCQSAISLRGKTCRFRTGACPQAGHTVMSAGCTSSPAPSHSCWGASPGLRPPGAVPTGVCGR